MERYLNNLEELYPGELKNVSEDLGSCCSNFINHSLSSEKIMYFNKKNIKYKIFYYIIHE